MPKPKNNLTNMQGVFDQINLKAEKKTKKIDLMEDDQKSTRNFILRADVLRKLYELKYNYYPNTSLSEIVEDAINSKYDEVKKK